MVARREMVRREIPVFLGNIQIIGGTITPVYAGVGRKEAFAAKDLVPAVTFPVADSLCLGGRGTEAGLLHIAAYAVADLDVFHVVFCQVLQQAAVGQSSRYTQYRSECGESLVALRTVLYDKVSAAVSGE